MEVSSLIREQLESIKPYIPGKPIEEVKRELGLDEVIKLASNENPFGPGKKAVEAIKSGAKKVSIYPDGNVHQLRRKLADKLSVKEDNLLFGNGSDEILVMLGQAFLEADDEIIMAETTFSEYEFSANIMGAKVRKVPLKNYRHDLEAMAEVVSDKTKIVFVCNPNNPTGTIVTKEEIDNFLAEIPDDVLVVFDEAYQEFVISDDYPNSLDYLKERENIIILRTFSKAYGLSGLRIGYAIADSELIGYLDRVRQPFNANKIAQEAALAALDDKEHIEKTLSNNNQQRKYLIKEFSKLGLEYVPTQANFILVEVGRDANQLFKQLLHQGVIIRSMSSYDYQTKIRVTIGLEEENKKFIKEFKQVLSS